MLDAEDASVAEPIMPNAGVGDWLGLFCNSAAFGFNRSDPPKFEGVYGGVVEFVGSLISEVFPPENLGVRV